MTMQPFSPEPTQEASGPAAISLDELSDVALDALPHGVIGLDEEGTILRYNLYESRFARLDRNQVIGRNFFSEVAPCTRNARFEGRFRSFVAKGTSEPERFEYVFDFAFGAQEVSVDIVRSGPRYYLLIGRLKASPPRLGVPEEQLAARQRDLAPDEARLGVLRDGLERRFVDSPASLLAALRVTCERLAPDSWQIFTREWGVQWGRRLAIELEASALESASKSLRDLPMREVGRMVSETFAERGWGWPTFDLGHGEDGVLLVELERSALAEAARRGRGPGAEGDLACHLMAGALSAILSSIAGKKLVAREIQCACAGAERCEIAVVSGTRLATLDAAIERGERGLERIRASLRAAEGER